VVAGLTRGGTFVPGTILAALIRKVFGSRIYSRRSKKALRKGQSALTLGSWTYDAEVIKMAMPIKPTPVLYDRAAHNFERRISENVSSPMKVTCAPSLDKAKSLVFARDKQPTK